VQWCVRVVSQPFVHTVHWRQRLIRGGTRLDDAETVRSARVERESTIHVVVSQLNLSEVITDDVLHANCRYCETSGALFEPRALCATCSSEAVEVESGRVVKGVTKWQDLMDVKIGCWVCNADAMAAGTPVGAQVRCSVARSVAPPL
jgi:hypothetical protein